MAELAWRHQKIVTTDRSMRSRNRGCRLSRVGYVDLGPEPILQEERDADEVEAVEAALGVVVDEQVEVAVGPGVVPDRRSEQEQGRRPHRPHAVGMGQEPGDGVTTDHEAEGIAWIGTTLPPTSRQAKVPCCG